LKGRNEIREVFNKGKRIGCQGAKLFVLKNELPHNRICFTFSRGFGTAVERNRARRLGREAYRNLKPRLRCGYDLILLVYPASASPAYAGHPTQVGQPAFAGRMDQLQYLFVRAGLLL
jgi:ribonuclease P protein component